MNVLEKLGQALTKHGLKPLGLGHEEVSLKMFESAKPFLCKPATEKHLKQSRHQFVKENITLVGKNSSFEKKVAKEYLSPLKGHPFTRHEVKNDYEVERANVPSRWGNSSHLSKRLQETIMNGSRQFIGDMLAALIACTPKTVKVSSENVVRVYPRFTMDHLPKIPNFKESPELFEDYLGLLTHTDFLYKGSSRLNGIIPKILRNLMHPGNIKTTHLRSTQSYNDMIRFFSERFDFATCREIFVQMRIENISPNTTTYNLLLRSMLKNLHIRKTKLPNDEILYYLRQMKSQDGMADSITWTTCYNFLNENISRIIFIEQMQSRNVPITSRFVYTVLKNGAYTSKECLDFLSNHQVPLDQNLFTLCIENLLKENRSDVAWIFLEHTLKEHRRDFSIGAKILNLFLIFFADKGRIDMAIMTYNTCVKHHHINPDTQTFDMLFKAMTRNGYSVNFPVILKYFQGLKEDWKLGNRNTYWILRAKSMAKFKISNKKQVTTLDLQQAELLLGDLHWGLVPEGFTEKVWKKGGPAIRKSLRYMSCLPTPLKNSNMEKSAPLNSSKRMKNYRRRIRYIAIQNSMAKRIPYAKDWYSSLRNELEERGVIQNTREKQDGKTGI